MKNIKKITAWPLCLAIIALFVLPGWTCNPAQSVPLAQAGYQAQVYAHAAARTGQAFNTYQPSSLQNGTYGQLLGRIDAASDLAERLFVTLDGTPEITPQNKLALLDEVDRYAALLDTIIADRVFPSLPDSLRNTIAVGRSIAAAIKLAISTIQTVQPTGTVKVAMREADATAAKAARSKSGTPDLVNVLGQIVADTAADVIAARGLPLAQVRDLRKTKRLTVARFIAGERARLGV